MARNTKELRDRFSSMFTSESEGAQAEETEEKRADVFAGDEEYDEAFDDAEGFIGSSRVTPTGRKRNDAPAVNKKRYERTTVVLNKCQYAIIREIALREGVSIRALIEQMFQVAIDRYEKKHGKVILDDGNRVKKIF